jgi:hypothetical protein
MTRRLPKVLAALAVFGAPLLASTSTAQAVEPQQHCVYNLDQRSMSCARTLSDPSLRASVAATDVLIARAYDGTGYTGSTIDYRTASGCTTATTNVDWQLQELGAWNDKISSIRTYNQCDVKLYQFTNFGGEATGWIDTNSDLRYYGAGWSNRASSIKFS